MLGRVNERRHARRQLAALEHRVRRAEGDSKLVGTGPAIERVLKLISKVAPTDSSVLIRGETDAEKSSLHVHCTTAA